eukprot:394341_1
MSSIVVHNDINQSTLNSIKYALFKQNTFKCEINKNSAATIEYNYGNSASGWINIRGGQFLLDTLDIYGSLGTVLSQKDHTKNDKVQVSNVRSYNQYFDPYGINTAIYVTHAGPGVFNMSNSHLFGAVDTFLYFFHSGNNYITDTTFHFGRVAVSSEYEVDSVYIKNCEFINVGKYYTEYEECLQIHSWTMSEYYGDPPFRISSQYVWIENTYILADDTSGIMSFIPGWQSQYYNELLESTVVLINNTIKRDDTKMLYNSSKGLINVI